MNPQMFHLLVQVQNPEDSGAKVGGSLPVLVLAVLMAVCLGHLRRPGISRRAVLALLLSLTAPLCLFLGYFVDKMNNGSGSTGCMGVGSLILFIPAAVILALLGLRDLKRRPREFQSGQLHATIALIVCGLSLIVTVLVLATSK